MDSQHNRSPKLFPKALQAVSALVITTIFFLDSARDWISGNIPWPFNFMGTLRNVLEWTLNILVTGIIDAITQFFILGVEYFLIYENPRYIPELNEYWVDSLVLYLFIVFAMMFAYYAVFMLLADTEKADVQRIVERLILSAIFLFISRDVYGFFVALTNSIAHGILPSNYTFFIGIELLNALATSATVLMTALLIAVFGGFGIFISGIIFYLILAIRMFIVYVVYALMPVLLGLWVVDVGPGKYGKFFADFMIKIAAVMMVMGILIAGILAVGAEFGNPDAQQMEGADLASEYDATGDGTVVLATDPQGPDSHIVGADGGEFGSSELSDVMLSMFMFLGTLWLVIATVTSVGGMLLSAGAASPGGTGGMHGSTSGRRNAGVAGHQEVAGSQWGAEYNGHTSGSAYAHQMDDGDVVVANPSGGGMRLNPDAGPFESSRETFAPEDNPLASDEASPNPFNTEPVEPEEPPTLSEKADYMSEQAAETVGETADKYTDGKATDMAETAGAYFENASDRFSDAVPETAEHVAGLGKRTGSAAWSVFKQPDLGTRVGEARRIARDSDSPIMGRFGNNEPPETPPDDRPVIAQGKDPYILGRGANTGGDTATTEATGTGDSAVDTASTEDTSDYTVNPDGDVTSSTESGDASADDSHSDPFDRSTTTTNTTAETDTSSETETLDDEDVSSDGSNEEGTLDSESEVNESSESAFEDDSTVESHSGDTDTDTGTDTGTVSDDVQEELETARNDVDSLKHKWQGELSTRGSNPFPEFYGESIEETLKLAEQVPEFADELRKQGIDPDELQKQLAEQGQTAAEVFSDALGSGAVGDLSAVQAHIDDVNPEFTRGITQDGVIDIASASAPARAGMTRNSLSDVKDVARANTTDGSLQRVPAKRFEEKLDSMEFDSKEQEIAFHLHAQNASQAMKQSVTDSDFEELNNVNRF